MSLAMGLANRPVHAAASNPFTRRHLHRTPPSLLGRMKGNCSWNKEKWHVRATLEENCGGTKEHKLLLTIQRSQRNERKTSRALRVDLASSVSSGLSVVKKREAIGGRGRIRRRRAAGAHCPLVSGQCSSALAPAVRFRRNRRDRRLNKNPRGQGPLPPPHGSSSGAPRSQPRREFPARAAADGRFSSPSPRFRQRHSAGHPRRAPGKCRI